MNCTRPRIEALFVPEERPRKPAAAALAMLAGGGSLVYIRLAGLYAFLPFIEKVAEVYPRAW